MLTPLTIPVVASTVARLVLLLLHVPPVMPSLRPVVDPAHTDAVPEIAGGNAFIVTTALPLMVVVHRFDVFVPITV